MSRQALIVGSGGQDGTLLTQLLTGLGYTVHGLRRDTVDILDAASIVDLLATRRPDEIYYLAAYHHSSESLPPSSADLFHHSMNVHFHGLVNFLDAIVRTSPASRLFFASSSHIFGTTRASLQTEETPSDPQSEYAITKVAGMRACAHYRRASNVFASVGVLYNHESPLRKPSFLSKKIALAAARIACAGKGELELGDLDAQVDWGYAGDYVDAMHRILQADCAADYIVATGKLHTVREFAEIAFRHVRLDYRDFVIGKSGMSLRNIGVRAGDSSRLRQATGWTPRVGFEAMVRGLVQFEVEALAAGTVAAVSRR